MNDIPAKQYISIWCNHCDLRIITSNPNAAAFALSAHDCAYPDHQCEIGVQQVYDQVGADA